MPEPTAQAPLSPALGATLAALVRTVVPHAAADPARFDRLLRRITADIRGLPPHKQKALLDGVFLFGSWVGALVVLCFPRAYRLQPPATQARILARWLGSPIPALRAAASALRRLILFAEYTTAEAQREVRYRGPYHSRGPAFPWEGALQGEPRDDEPVARAVMPTSAHLPPALLSTVAPIDPPPATLRTPEPLSRAPETNGRVLGAALLPSDRMQAGVIVIGSGAGGAVAAARLAEAGHDVLILESGALVTGAELDEREHELYARLYAEGGQRTTDDASLAILQGAAVGGGTTVNWMIMLRTPDWVLDEWAAYHGIEGMRPADLAPVFDRVEREVHATLVPDDAHSPSNRIILDGARALGWSAYAGRINARECVRTGFCGYGCRYGAKQGGLQTFLPRAQAAEARLVTHATAKRISLAERGGSFPKKCVTFIHAPPGEVPREVEAEAPIVIVAGGAVETPVLLQRSDMGGGGTGQFLRVHPVTPVFAHYEREIYAAGGIPLTAVCDQFQKLDAGYGTVIECPPLHAGLAAAALPGFGMAHRRLMQRYPELGTLLVLVRDGMERGNSDGEVQALREGGTSIQYRLNPRDAKHMEAGMVAAARLHFASGAREVWSAHTRPVRLLAANEVERLRGHRFGPNQIALFSAHVNGTCRFGIDRETAGTDPHGEVFGTPGVFVADGSLLPTALGVNPQETIMSLSTIVSERIASRRRPG